MTTPATKPHIPEPSFVWPIRIYWEDTDGGGVVYHSNYLKFFERARTEWLRKCGIEQRQLAAERGILFAVHAANLAFIRPARLDQALTVRLYADRLRRASLSVQQDLYDPSSKEVICRGGVEIVCLDANRFKPIGIPSDILAELAREQ
jgi:acyl-CoA thioester hydrolase